MGHSLTGSAWVELARRAGSAAVPGLVWDAVVAGHARPLSWATVSAPAPDGRRVTFRATALPLAIGTASDHVYAPVTPELRDRLARHLGLLPLTARMMDVLHAHAALAVPFPAQDPGAGVAACLPFARAVQGALAARPGALSTLPFKIWAVPQPSAGEPLNYGAFDAGAPYRNAEGARLWQPLSGRHGPGYWDYSQVLLLAHPAAAVGTTPMRLERIGSDPSLWPAISASGPVRWSYYDEPAGVPVVPLLLSAAAAVGAAWWAWRRRA